MPINETASISWKPKRLLILQKKKTEKIDALHKEINLKGNKSR